MLRRLLPWMTGAAIAGVLVWSFVYLKDIHPLGSLEARLGGDNLSGVAIRFEGSRLVGRLEGKPVWQFDADTIELSRDRRLATFRGIREGVLLRNGRNAATISAGKVVYDTYTRNISVPGEATVRLQDGPELRVRDSHWNSKESRLECRGGVSMSLAGSELQGDGLTLELEKKQLDITKVRGKIRL